MKKLAPYLLTLFLLVTIASCRKGQHTQWDTELLVPIATSNLSLLNLVKDSSLVTNADQSLTLAYNKNIYQFNLADQVVHIPDTSIGQKFTLDSLALGNQFIVYNLSMGTLATNMELSTDPVIHLTGQLIIANNLDSMVVPAITGFTSSIFAFNGTQYFTQATLAHGTVFFAINNYFPIPIDSGAVVELLNTNGIVLASHVLPAVPAGDSIFQQFDIAPGTTINGAMNIKVINLSSSGSTLPPPGHKVKIDTSNYMRLWMQIGNLRVSDAIAIFPSQDLVSVTQEITNDIADRKLTYIDARRGQLHIYITSSVQQPLRLTYILDGAYDKLGRPLKAYTQVPAATAGIPAKVDSILDISGYSINLTGKDGSKFNTYTQTVIAHIDSNGRTAHITLADSLHIQYQIQNVAPNYIKGYAGKDTISANDSADFAFLNIFKSGTIDLQSVSMNLHVQNGIGVDGQVKINSLKAYSPLNGYATLNAPTIIGRPLNIGRATDFPLTPANNNFSLNNGNSNIKNLLDILPNKLYYDVQVKTNVNGNNGQYRDFAYLESNLQMSLDAEIPLSLIANHLVLKDTIGFDLSNTNTNVNGITDGVINVITENKYPIQTNLTMVIYDSVWHPVDTLVMNQPVLAADLDNNCRAEQPKRTKIPEYITEARMTRIKQGRRAVLTADFSTVSNNAICNGQHLKIYSDYTLGITLTAKFNYKVKTGF